PAPPSLPLPGLPVCYGKAESVLNHMIEMEVLRVFYNSAEQIGKYFTERLQLPWPEYDGHLAMVVPSRIRNCFIHNGCRADARLAEVSDWAAGTQIELALDDVHLFGVDARDFAGQLWRAAHRNG